MGENVLGVLVVVFALLLIAPVLLAFGDVLPWLLSAPWLVLSFVDWLVLLVILALTFLAQWIFFMYVNEHKEIAIMRLITLLPLWAVYSLAKFAFSAFGFEWVDELPWISFGELTGMLLAILALPLDFGFGVVGGYIDGHSISNATWCSTAQNIALQSGYDLTDVGIRRGLSIGWSLVFSEAAGEYMYYERLQREFFDFDLRSSFSGAYQLVKLGYTFGCFSA
ncbi:hypothetical protein J7400_15545 [Shimia sp. R9_2]|uniref:hypothetical protein n=1 Tax=Shimia sp. R9_2 TaxID=2821112 RepID=UPI001ADCA79C|nr:hypothetical protein [Shimia sp. R9_2]MBO9398102.1 hypothetical protein [Shimia sp. R9_2]